ncbi:unnamed protein product [Moneuplotes crassus]|uniref:SUMO-conjugating enzyme UBC9 n=1 Tax=Euplotes crassus TaxID=5936 RepID=A0AAD2D501_EUPCR|nr:unnamed protein product [Moneuplotes crassus]
MEIWKQRIMMERKNWRKNHPHGFVAKIAKDNDGNLTLNHWICIIPGKKGGLWEGGNFVLHMTFPEEYPNKAPKCQFAPVLFHPNVYPSGTVCLSILNEDEDWMPSISIKEILLGIQNLLDHPNPDSPAQTEPYYLYVDNPARYAQTVKDQIKKISVKV